MVQKILPENRASFGFHRTGIEGVDPDLSPPEFLGERAGDRVHRRFARAIHGPAWQGMARDEGAEVDDAAALAQVLDGGLRHQQQAEYVEIEVPVEILRRDLFKGSEGVHHLQDRAKSLKDKLAWLPRLGSELTHCGFMLGVEIWSPKRDPRTVGIKISDLGSKVDWLTETAGLGTVYNDTFRVDKGTHEKLLDERPHLNASDKLFRNMQQRVITLASKSCDTLNIDSIINPPWAKHP